MSEFAKHLEILNANSSGQGFCPHHLEQPYHSVLVEHGWEYSHTTPVVVTGERQAFHTYKKADWNVSVSCRPGWRIEASRSGSGRRFIMFGAGTLGRYLKRKNRELCV